MFKFFFLFIFCMGASAAPLDDQQLKAKEAWHVVYSAMLANKSWALKTRSEQPAYYNGQLIRLAVSNMAHLNTINNLVLTSIYENSGDGFLDALLILGKMAENGISGRKIEKYLAAVDQLLVIAEPSEYKNLIASIQGKPCESFLYTDQKAAAYAKAIDDLGTSRN